ncbi:unnamed protein product [Protopolystoma xenopodis]|uniref:ACB domain-containing protein n=1 Tax=Protopolystoma xenopodis TaxID=117903 RepID=A0A3S5CDL1_9PLAT|nr:unnamed protein product [Protopolystoma xenopodis]
MEVIDVSKQFDQATAFVRSIAGELNEEQLLTLYGLFKQVVQHFLEAWNKLGEKITKEEAQKTYIEVLSVIRPDWNTTRSSDPTGIRVCVSRPVPEAETEEPPADAVKTLVDFVKDKQFDRFSATLRMDSTQANVADEMVGQ